MARNRHFGGGYSRFGEDYSATSIGAKGQNVTIYGDASGKKVDFVAATNILNLACTTQLNGVALTPTAAELNVNAGITPGIVLASKAVVVGANKNIDTIAIADLKLGAGAGTSVTSTAAELNLLDGVTATMAELNLAAAGLTAGMFVIGQKFTVTYPQIAAADVAKTFFIAPAACKVISGYERHVTVAGQAGVLTVEKLTPGQAPGAGGDCFTVGFDLTSAANTSASKTAVVTAVGTLAAGNALCLKVQSGTATSYALGTITLTMQWV